MQAKELAALRGETVQQEATAVKALKREKTKVEVDAQRQQRHAMEVEVRCRLSVVGAYRGHGSCEADQLVTLEDRNVADQFMKKRGYGRGEKRERNPSSNGSTNLHHESR